MDQHGVEGMIVIERAFDHGLELRPVVMGGAQPWIDIGRKKLAALGDDAVGDLAILVGDGEIAIGLPARGDAAVGTYSSGSGGENPSSP